MTYTFGADPELFCFDTKSEKFISVHDLLPGTKAKPFKVEFGAVQVDGLAAEFNIDPAEDFKTFSRNIKAVRKQIEEMVQENGGKHLVLRAIPTATFDQDYFDKLPPDTKVLGCEPDYCGFTKDVNPRPDPGNKPFRTGGGHVHIGWGNGFDLKDTAHFADCCLVALNLYANGLNKDYLWDNDKDRRQLYGSKHSLRPKSFGMEYRYLSNAWVDNDLAMKYVFEVAENTMKAMDSCLGRTRVRYLDELRIPNGMPYNPTGVTYTYIEGRSERRFY